MNGNVVSFRSLRQNKF